jgi:hypothetical protein
MDFRETKHFTSIPMNSRRSCFGLKNFLSINYTNGRDISSSFER